MVTKNWLEISELAIINNIKNKEVFPVLDKPVAVTLFEKVL